MEYFLRQLRIEGQIVQTHRTNQQERNIPADPFAKCHPLYFTEWRGSGVKNIWCSTKKATLRAQICGDLFLCGVQLYCEFYFTEGEDPKLIPARMQLLSS